MSKLKYYFAVDTSYVVKKLGLLVFPFTHKVCTYYGPTLYKRQIILLLTLMYIVLRTSCK